MARVLNALSLFSGIGGLDLAAEMAGIKTAAFCEIEPFPVEVLKKRFPGVPIFDDIKTLTKESFMEVMFLNGGGMDASQPVDIIFGGFPCQDLSQAGKQVGLTGARSGLWFEMLRVISEFRPRYVVAENVRGAVNLALDTVYSGLVGEGYKVYPYVIPASAVGAPHQRERLFVVGVREDVANTLSGRLSKAWPREQAAGVAGEDTCCAVADIASERLQRMRTARKQESEIHAGKIVPVRDSIGSGELWPTPSVHGNYNRKGLSENSGNGLSTAVSLWPTPREFMYKDSVVDRGKGNIGEKVGGQLNPDWVGQLMGYPEGWTDLDIDEPKEWQGWPALLGEDQYPYEFPRTTTGCKNRAKQLKAYGNSVVPAQAYPFFRAITEIETVVKEGRSDEEN